MQQSLFYSDSGGKKPVIVFLHYFGGSLLSWGEVIAHLKDYYRCIGVDLRGFGNSAQSGKHSSVNEHASSVKDLIQSLHIKTFFLAGHSMGGKIALALAAESSVLIKGLILTAPSPPSSEPFHRGERVALRNAFRDEEKLKNLLLKTFVKLPAKKIFDEAVADNMRSSEKARRWWIDKGTRENISGSMHKINCPVMIISGQKDKKFPTSFLKKEFQSKFCVTKMKEIKGSGHLIPLEAPRETALAILHFCRQQQKTKG